MKLSSFPLISGVAFWGFISAVIAHSDPNEIRVFGATGVAGKEPDFVSRFIPYDSDPDGYGVQRADFSEDRSIHKGIAYTRWLNKNWGLEAVYQIGDMQYTSDSASSDPRIHFQWAQWVVTPPFPIVTRDETIDVEKHPELDYESKRYEVNLLYRWQKDKLSAVLQAGVVYHQTDGLEIRNLFFKSSTQVSRGSLLSSQSYLVLGGVDTEQFGANFGAGVSYELTKHFSLFADVRYHYLPEKETSLSLVDFEPIVDFWVADNLEAINALYETRSINLNPSNLFVSFGLSLHF